MKSVERGDLDHRARNSAFSIDETPGEPAAQPHFLDRRELQQCFPAITC